MAVFRSKLETLMPTEELRFDATPGFGRYKKFLEHAIAHPAKMNQKLLTFLIKKFTEEGDVVLDPMAGSGSTGVIAALNGRNAVCVDIEEKFHKWMEKARKKVERQKTFTQKGFIKNICGDARKLSELLREVDVVVTSPPYSDISKPSNIKNPISKEDFEKRKAQGDHSIYHDIRPERKGTLYEYYEMIPIEKYGSSPQNIDNLPHGSVDAIVTSPPYSNIAKSKEGAISPHMQGLISKLSGIPVKEFANDVEKLKEAVKIAQSKIPFQYSENPENIGNLPLGKVDAVITSPPYGEAQEGSGIAKRGYQGDKHSPTDLVGKRSYMPDKFESEENISRLPMGEVDAVITSPPYADQEVGKGIRKKRWEKIKDKEGFKGRKEWKTGTPSHYSENRENIGNLLFQPDVVITSPPYEHSVHDTFEKRETWNNPLDKHDVRKKNLPVGFSEDPQNIGNMQKETYLEAMLKVYDEMFKVLKLNGKAIIVIKPFIRNKKVVDLPYHTWLLLKKAGFKLVKLYKLRLKNVSFWRILYRKKFPSVAKINHEYVLVCQKVGD